MVSPVRMVAQGLLGRRLTFGDQGQVVGNADDLHRVRQVVIAEGLHHLGLELHGPRLARHVRGVLVADHPLIGGIDPGVQALVQDEFDCLLGGGGIEGVALDNAQIGVHQHPAIEAGDGGGQGQGLDQHLHAAWRPPAGDRQADPRRAQGLGRRLGPLGEDLVLGDQGAVHIRQHQADAMPAAHAARAAASGAG